MLADIKINDASWDSHEIKTEPFPALLSISSKQKWTSFSTNDINVIDVSACAYACVTRL